MCGGWPSSAWSCLSVALLTFLPLPHLCNYVNWISWFSSLAFEFYHVALKCGNMIARHWNKFRCWDVWVSTRREEGAPLPCSTDQAKPSNVWWGTAEPRDDKDTHSHGKPREGRWIYRLCARALDYYHLFMRLTQEAAELQEDKQHHPYCFPKICGSVLSGTVLSLWRLHPLELALLLM